MIVSQIFRQIPGTVKTIDYILAYERMWKKEIKTYHYGNKSSFELNYRWLIFIPCKINGENLLVFYDSGQQDEFVESISSDTLFPKRCKTLKSTMMTYSKQSITMIRGLKYYYIESDFFDFNPLLGELFYMSSDTITPKCVPKSTDKSERGRYTLGAVAFPSYDKTMLLNFSDTSLTILDSTGIYDTTGFMPLKSKRAGYWYYVSLTVDSVEYDFLFDTGSELFLSLPNYEKHKKDDDIHIAGYWGKDLAGLVIDTLIEQHTNTIKMGDLDSINGTICYIKQSTMPNMGMPFISNYDWIIDAYKGKIYAKKIKDADFWGFKNYYRVSVFDTLLQISLLPVGETEYELFSIIDSVNGEKINADNICRMRALLNKEGGFKNNQIVFLPPPEKKMQ
jgi:hypothetical protein